jgi:hypothetical protein
MNGLCGTAPFPLPPSDTESAPASPADSNREKKLKIIPRKMNIYLKFVI